MGKLHCSLINILTFLIHQDWQQLEVDLLSQEVPVAVYFAYEDDQLTEIYEHIRTAITSDQAGSAFEGISEFHNHAQNIRVWHQSEA